MRYHIRELDIKNRHEGLSEFTAIGSTLPGSRIMAEKIFPLAIKVKGLRPVAANILKQEMLARGGDVVTSRNTLLDTHGTTDVIIEGPSGSFESLIGKLKIQPFGLKQLSSELKDFLANHKKRQGGLKYTIAGREYDLASSPLIMGILNITPDSFYDGGRYIEGDAAKRRIEDMIDSGADIIDVGGMSSRPGSKPVDMEEESGRVIPAIEYISRNHDIPISIDTYRSEVASRAMSAGAHIINDISALSMDHNMAPVSVSTGATVILMHMKGTPENMQDDPQYENVIDEIYEYLEARALFAREAGIPAERIIIDPGIGFGKTTGHNLMILNKIREFAYMGYPVLVGASRKSFIGKILDVDAGERLEGSLAAAVWCCMNGAGILRVHDVRETVKAVKIAGSIISGFER